jgi:cephalosporin hydroxylase
MAKLLNRGTPTKSSLTIKMPINNIQTILLAGKPPKKNLVICVVGDFSYHKHWLDRKKRNFDLMLVYYGKVKDKYKEEADYYLQTEDLLKLENISAAINRYYDVVQSYDAVFMPDDDMRLRLSSINRLFQVFYRYDLDLAQPTIGFGIICYPILKTVPGYILRYSNFVEIGCPIFKRDLLLEMLPLFTLNRSGSAIDHLWSQKCQDKKMAMIDCVPFFHLKAVAWPYSQNLSYTAKAKKLGINMMKEQNSLITQYKLNTTKKIYGSIKPSIPIYWLKILSFHLFVFFQVIERAQEVYHCEGLFILFKKAIYATYFFVPERLRLEIMRAHSVFRHFTDKSKDHNSSFYLQKLSDLIFSGCYRPISPAQIKEEIFSLLKIVGREQPRLILEIGTWNGGTLFLFSQIAALDATIISLDLPNGEFGGGYSKYRVPLYKSFAQSKQKIHLLRVNSHEPDTLVQVKTILSGQKLDFLFIDGDHSYEGVKKDFNMYGPLVRDRGVIAFHDITPYPFNLSIGVSKFWQEIKTHCNHREIVANWCQGGFGIGVVRVGGGMSKMFYQSELP